MESVVVLLYLLEVPIEVVLSCVRTDIAIIVVNLLDCTTFLVLSKTN